MNELIEEIFSTKKVKTSSGKELPLRVNLAKKEGEFLGDLIAKNSSIKKTLEVGCAYGISSLFITKSLKGREGAHHTILDPNQNTTWEGVGIHNLKQSGFSSFDLVEEKSEFALPNILKENEGAFDFILVDGWHTFDHTLLDCFYAIRLLKVGGYLVVDDVTFPGIRRVVDYLIQYPCLTFEGAVTVKRKASFKKQIVISLCSLIPKSLKQRVFSKSFQNRLQNEAQPMVALKKISDDQRAWDWFRGDF